jgi:hypothetical protein
MNINPGVSVPLASRNLGDLSKNTPAVKELLMAILKAMENVGAHKVTRPEARGKFSFIIHLSTCLLSLFFNPLTSSLMS